MRKAILAAAAATVALGIFGTALPANASTSAFSTSKSSSDNVQVSDHRVNVTLRKISNRELFINGKETDAVARYEVRAQRNNGRLLFDKNISVYKAVEFTREFKDAKAYGSNASLVKALRNATDGSEQHARNDFRNIFGSLGKFQNSDGSFSSPQQVSYRN